MARRAMRSPRTIVVLVFGLILGAVWAAGELATAAGPNKPGVSVTGGDGILVTSPTASSFVVSAIFAGSGLANAVSRSDHHHDGQYAPIVHDHDARYSLLGHDHNGQYLPLTGGMLNGNLEFLNGAEMIAPRVQNASSPPGNAAPGQLWFDLSTGLMMFHDGSQWRALGGGDAPLNAVSTAPSYSTSTVGASQTPCVVNLNVPVGTEVVVEFGAQFEVSSSNNTGFLAVDVALNGAQPGFNLGEARHDRSTGSQFMIVQGSSLKTFTINTPGVNTVRLWTQVSSSQGGSNAIRAPWLKVTKKTT